MDSRKKLFMLALAGALLLTIVLVGVVVGMGSSGASTSAGDEGASFPISILIAVWVVVFIPLLARRKEGEDELPSKVTVWVLVLVGLVILFALATAYLLLR